VAFIDEHRERFGVEPICRVLTEHGCKIAPNTFWVAKKRPPSTRAVRDAALMPEVVRVFEDNLFVYGADKVWAQLNRENIRVARCTVERLMRAQGLSGARRGKAFTVTTHHDDRQQRPADLVERKFRAPTPNRLWVADLTYVKTHSGWVYVAFIIDVYSRMIVGWQASRSLRSDLAIDALEMAVFNRRHAGHDLSQLTHHSDRGVQGGFDRSSQHLDVEVEDGATAGMVGHADGKAGDEVAGQASCSSRGGAGVLGQDRRGPHERGCCDRVWGVWRCRRPLVPRTWRDADHRVEPTVGQVSVVR
jgi:hypothetical protein